MNPLVVNLFAGPGTGKSTTATGVFSDLKLAGVNAEFVSEFAKDLVWEDRKAALSYQHYVIGKQMWKIERVRSHVPENGDPVEVIITDSPILFGLIYGKDYSEHWEQHVIEVFNSWHTLNFRLHRDSELHPYNPAGRTQTEDEAKALDEKIDRMLRVTGTPHIHIHMQEGRKSIEAIVDRILHVKKLEQAMDYFL
jgi:hypothetical protein